MLHKTLWDANFDLAQACLNHPFVQGLAKGNLDEDAFMRYVAQDAFFLESFFRAYAVAAAKCDEIDQAQGFIELMDGVMDELSLHQDYSESLGIDLECVVPFAETSAYTNFLMRTAWHGDVEEILAAMVPCMKLYAYLGVELAKENVADNPYQGWIDTYSGEDFQGLAQQIESMLDEMAEDTPQVRDAYRYAMQCELNFFAAPLRDED